MDAVDAAAPGSALFVLPGPQQPAAAGTGANQWGNGFNAAPALLNAGLTGGREWALGKMTHSNVLCEALNFCI
jgi:hypothetical protein